MPRVLGVDDFASRKRCSYATVLIDAETRQRADALPDGKAGTGGAREHPGVQVVCRAPSSAYAEAIRASLETIADSQNRVSLGGVASPWGLKIGKVSG